jgi:hypothetical protein
MHNVTFTFGNFLLPANAQLQLSPEDRAWIAENLLRGGEMAQRLVLVEQSPTSSFAELNKLSTLSTLFRSPQGQLPCSPHDAYGQAAAPCRRPVFTGLATQAYSATEFDGWEYKLSRVSQDRAPVQPAPANPPSRQWRST